MKKLEKIFWSVVLILVVLAIIGAIVASVFLGNIVKKGVETVGPRITQVSVKVDEVHLTLLTGSASVKGLVVGNPAGYQTPQAISAGMISVGVNPLSVLSDKIVMRSIHVESPEITFEGGLSGNNLSQILDNVNASAKTGRHRRPPILTAQAKSSKKFEVDDLLITGAKVHVSLTDLGGKGNDPSTCRRFISPIWAKNEEGITAADLSRNVLNAVLSATLKAISNDKDLGKDAQLLLKGSGVHVDTGTSNLIQGVFKALNK